MRTVRGKRIPLKVQDCGTSKWDCEQHGLDLPYAIKTHDFRVTGTGHRRIEPIYKTYCDRSACSYTSPQTMPEDKLAAWLCQNAHSFVLVTCTRPQWTIISFLDEDDAAAFRDAWVA